MDRERALCRECHAPIVKIAAGRNRSSICEPRRVACVLRSGETVFGYPVHDCPAIKARAADSDSVEREARRG